MSDKTLGWIFKTDGHEGIPYIQCPHCNRKISGKKVLLADQTFDHCPDCSKPLNFDNVSEENMLYVASFYGDDES